MGKTDQSFFGTNFSLDELSNKMMFEKNYQIMKMDRQAGNVVTLSFETPYVGQSNWVKVTRNADGTFTMMAQIGTKVDNKQSVPYSDIIEFMDSIATYVSKNKEAA